MNRLILSVADLFAWPVRLLGGDYGQFRAILETKLTLDSRRPMVGFANRKERESGGAFSGALVFYALIGVVIGAMLLRVNSPLVGMTIVHSIILVMLTTTLIADFTNVLLDTADNTIVQPRPVSGRTLFLARSAHICTYLGLLGLSLSLATMGVGAYRWSYLFPLVHLVTLSGGILLAICLASLFYLVVLRLAHPERVRDIIVYLQILFSVFIFGGYQFLPRLLDVTRLEEHGIERQAWVYFYPPAWLAAPFDLLAGRVGPTQVILTAMGLAGPLTALLLVTRGLAARFNQMLAAMEASGQRGPASDPHRVRRPLGAGLAGLISRRPQRRAAFEFMWTVLSRDRLFKSRTYPSLAILLIIPLSLLLTDPRGLSVAFEELPRTQRHLMLLYIACTAFPTAIIQMRYSPHWQAAWVYESLPIARPGELLMAAFWVIFLRFVLPAFIFISVVLLWIWGPRVLPDIGLALLVTAALSLGECLILGPRLPFGEQFDVREGSGRFGKNMLLLLVAFGLYGVHSLLLHTPWGVPAGALVAAVVMYGLARRYAATSWAALRRET